MKEIMKEEMILSNPFAMKDTIQDFKLAMKTTDFQHSNINTNRFYRNLSLTRNLFAHFHRKWRPLLSKLRSTPPQTAPFRIAAALPLPEPLGSRLCPIPPKPIFLFPLLRLRPIVNSLTRLDSDPPEYPGRFGYPDRTIAHTTS